MRQYINWKFYLVFSALCIVVATLYYTNQLAKKLAEEETKKIEQVVRGIKTLNDAKVSTQDLTFISKFIEENTTIPLIITDSKGDIYDYRNIDVSKSNDAKKFLKSKISEYRSMRAPIEIDYQVGKNYIYYGESYLLSQLRYFPYVLMGIIMLFLLVVLVALSSAHRSMQNQVWVGLSKETAHQLGTPLSSIEGWLELLKDNEENKEAVAEMQKDLDRLKLVADRFGKVGSVPQLEEEDVMIRISNMVSYMQKRTPSKVIMGLQTNEEEILAYISGPLFDWVLENLLRNALDAMDGKGNINVKVENHSHQVWIDVSDTGKGIPKHQIKKIFYPGFTTKKRGWGLGLSLSKRIIEKYHHGSLYVKHSEIGKGTTFRIILRR